GQAAAQMPDGGDGEVHHAFGHAAGGHEHPRQHKKGNRHQRVVLAGLEHLDGQAGQRILREEDDGDDAREPQADGNRHADCHAEKQQNRTYHRVHPCSSLACRPMASAASSARCRESARPVSRSYRICKKRKPVSAMPSGMTASTHQRSIGMSSSSMPTCFILRTYCIEPTMTKPTYARHSNT